MFDFPVINIRNFKDMVVYNLRGNSFYLGVGTLKMASEGKSEYASNTSHKSVSELTSSVSEPEVDFILERYNTSTSQDLDISNNDAERLSSTLTAETTADS